MTEPLPVSVSSNAAKRIAEILRSEPAVEKIRQEEDLVVERDGVTVVVDPVSLEYMKGSEIDFVDELIGASFQIRNPNASSGCGCGTSFSV
jgi:iron-sulfur cluster insertion protein